MNSLFTNKRNLFLATPISTPVVLIIFRKPHETQQVFNAIRKARPSKLYLICDGPRPNNSNDSQDIAACQKIVQNVNWPCEVIKDYSPINLGCALRISSGLTKVFDKEEQAIVFEDDCLPSQSFFPFCQELLTYYKDHKEIMQISGTSVQRGRNKTPYSYIFSKYPSPWGYATWARAWKSMNDGIHDWDNPLTRNRILKNLPAQKEKTFWTHLFDQVTSDNKGQPVWPDLGYQRMYSMWYHNGISITSNENLVSYIGFTDTATTTKGTSPSANLPRKEISSIKHPPQIKIHHKADQWRFNFSFGDAGLHPFQRLLISTKTRLSRIKHKILSS